VCSVLLLLLPQAKTDTLTTAAAGSASVASESAVGTTAATTLVSWREHFLFKPLKSSSAKLVIELRYRKSDLSKDKVSALNYRTNDNSVKCMVAYASVAAIHQHAL
jgi:hypothetical protein